MYLHENMLQFYQDIGDVANCMETYSTLDGHYASLEYQYGNQQYLNEIQELNALIESMSITECNLHGGNENPDPRFKKHMVQM